MKAIICFAEIVAILYVGIAIGIDEDKKTIKDG